MLSARELKKRKAKKFFNKDNLCFWVDDRKRFYVASKSALPTKKKMDEYKTFKDNSQAVLVRWGKGWKDKCRWFKDFSEFEDVFNAEEADLPAVMGSISYRIIKTGYNGISPMDDKVIYELPEFDLLGKLNENKKKYRFNENYAYRCTAKEWLVQDKIFEYVHFDYYEIIERLIKEYERMIG